MHCPAMFREERLEVLYQLIRSHPLATLITQGEGGLSANLMPLVLEDGVLRGHVARNHQQLADLRAGGEVLVVFQGPQTYVTPSWYASKAEHGKVVPTWNFVMVQVRGVARAVEDAGWIRAHLERLTEQLEGGREQPWTVDDAPEDFVAAMVGALMGIEIPITAVEGKWKVSQNRNEADRQGVRRGLAEEGRCPEMLAVMGP